MPLTVSVTVSQSAISPSQVTITDTSSGSDIAVTERRVIIQDAFGEYITGNGTLNYDVWPISNTTITLDIITELIGNVAVNILVQWVDVGGAVLYSDNNNYPLPRWGQNFFVYLVQQQGLTPGVYQDLTYSGNLAVFWANLVAGINQVEIGNDPAGAQNCFNRVNQMMQNENTYF